MNQPFDPPHDPSSSAPPPSISAGALPRPPGHSPPMSQGAVVPQVVHIVSRPGGMAWAWGTMIGLIGLGLVLVVGLVLGLLLGIGAAAGAAGEEYVVRSTYRDGDSNNLAIIPIIDEIDARQAEFVRAAVDDVLDDSSVRAVVLRVDSPGGDVAASDQIWYQVNRLKRSGLPVVASYGGIAASGGYYVSCAADQIIAEETCITGSIGVIAQVLTLEGLMDKVGVKPVTLVATGSPEKNVANDMFRTWDERDKQTVRTMLDAAYATFNKRVRDGRKNAIPDGAAIDSLANGSIYTAQQAKDNGLIDGIGYLDDAIAKAESLAALTAGRSTVVLVRQPPSLFGDGLFMQGGARTPALDADAIRGLVNDLAAPRVLYRMH